MKESILKYFSIFSEDVSETVTAWYAWYHKPSTVPASEIENIAALIPSRLDVLSQYLLSRKWAEYNSNNKEVMTLHEPHYIGGWERYEKLFSSMVL